MITEIVHNNYSLTEVYCRKLHTIKNIKELPCKDCPCFFGYLFGKGVQCYWEDYSPVEELERIIPYEDRNKEMLRVAELIDKKIIPKDPIETLSVD